MRYSTPEIEMIVVESEDIVLASVVCTTHNYVNGVCQNCGTIAETNDDEF